MNKEAKAGLRRTVRAAFPGDDERQAASEAMCRALMDWEVYRRAKTVGAYVPLRREADVWPVLQEVLSSGRTLVLPRVEREGEMTLRRVEELQQLIPGTYGIPEPAPDAPVMAAEALELLIVPLEAIDRRGMRLGKGGGYYDRLLPHTDCLTVGAVLPWQWVESVPCDVWDRPLDAAADPDGIHLFTGKD